MVYEEPFVISVKRVHSWSMQQVIIYQDQYLCIMAFFILKNFELLLLIISISSSFM